MKRYSWSRLHIFIYKQKYSINVYMVLLNNASYMYKIFILLPNIICDVWVYEDAIVELFQPIFVNTLLVDERC